MPERTPIDEFRRALAGPARAIARDPEVEVAFASEPVPASGKTARVPSPGPSLQAKLVAEARGAADAVALPWAYDATTTQPAVFVNVAAQGDSDSIGCRITIDDVAKDERSPDNVNAYTFCVDKSG